MSRPARPPLQLSLQFADASPRALLPRHRVARWIRHALERPGRITVRIVGADEGLQLNAAYRGQDHPTNVITFDYAHAPVVEADLVLCAPVIAAEARRALEAHSAHRALEAHSAHRAHSALEAHYAHLVVHGTLHAQGWDHLDEAQASRMEARESALMLELGYPDPYRGR